MFQGFKTQQPAFWCIDFPWFWYRLLRHCRVLVVIYLCLSHYYIVISQETCAKKTRASVLFILSDIGGHLILLISRTNTMQNVERIFSLSKSDKEMLQRSEYDLQVCHSNVLWSPHGSKRLKFSCIELFTTENDTSWFL